MGLPSTLPGSPGTNQGQDVHAQVCRRGRVGQGPDGNTVCAGCRHCANIPERDASGHFHQRSAMNKRDGFTYESWRHVIQENHVGGPLQGIPHLRERLRFNGDREPGRRVLAGQEAGLGDADAPPLKQQEVIIFDQDTITKGIPMVLSSAQGHGPFLQGAQARDGFSGLQNRRVAAADRLTKLSREGGDARQVLEEIQGDSFRHEKRAGVAQDRQHGLSALDRSSVCESTNDPYPGIHRPEHFAG